MHVAIRIAAALLMLAASLASAQPMLAERWSSYRDFWFGFDSVSLDATDATKVADVAAYSKSNPTHRIGIDGPLGGEGAELDARRVGSVRDALIKAGVPADKIATGAFGSAQLRRARRVEVLVERRD